MSLPVRSPSTQLPPYPDHSPPNLDQTTCSSLSAHHSSHHSSPRTNRFLRKKTTSTTMTIPTQLSSTANTPETITKKRPVPDGTDFSKNTPANKQPRTKTPSAAMVARDRPARNRKAPERYNGAASAVKPSSVKKPTVTKRVFAPDYITTNSNSRLVKADVYHLLQTASAWSVLTPAQQEELIALLPPHHAPVAAGDRPQELGHCDVFRTDVAKFQEDLGNGHLAKTWQEHAINAVAERAMGTYDWWKQEEAEKWWGQRSRAGTGTGTGANDG
ncbi:hypothetical protein CC78DRAFT_245115 [Lojkania enalia]|uniref:DEUBAD domain-containing protein n=1 Tax=Lojkania enalia TaxID=147567 RepID=A0A9P4K8V2_9PLEO|nr:hypothetical protein CC78DRAFT_245115 [Didymosphaeria enalia]